MSKKTDFNKEIYTDEKGGIDWAKLESDIRGYTRFQDQIRLLDMCLKAFGIKKTEICDALGLAQLKTLSNYEKGVSKPLFGNILFGYLKFEVKKTIIICMLERLGEIDKLLKENPKDFYEIFG